MIFYLQSLFLAAFAVFLFQRGGSIRGAHILMILAWLFGVSLIYFFYGPVGQLAFYQNDQRFHWAIVSSGYSSSDLGTGFDRFNSLRVPYTLPALLLTKLGFDVTVSLKFVSLCCALATMTVVEKFLESENQKFSVLSFWMVAGPSLTFFSILALRETMMVLFVVLLVFGRYQAGKPIYLIGLILLKPHLAASLIFGQVWGWVFSKTPRHWHLSATLLSCVAPVLLGSISFAAGNYFLYGTSFNLDQGLILKDQIVKVFSGFVGLQFLTVAYQTVEFSTSSLLLIRALFPEIVVVPLLFLIACTFVTPRHSQLRLGTLASFVFFSAISSGTEFMSFRQSLSFMPVMGVLAILTFSEIRGTAEPSVKRSST